MKSFSGDLDDFKRVCESSDNEFGNYKFKDGIDSDLRGKETFSKALDLAFEKTGVPKEKFRVTEWGKSLEGKSFPVEWTSENGAKVNIDKGHPVESGAPTIPHIGWQTGGKRGRGGRARGHIFIDDVPYFRD